ncbi:glutaredoxin family protein [Ammoniphilus resinae]|uniref:glutaredoxin family protein n=1 Tax=Ammoniphilus resinae TaxID=861532 RepID=UPI001AE70540
MQIEPNLEITVYTNPHCVHCHRQIDWMENHSIPFKEKDISKNESYLKELNYSEGVELLLQLFIRIKNNM